MTATKLRDGFRQYLRTQSESILWASEGDEAHSGSFYQHGAASYVFPITARELVKDSLNLRHIAQFCIEAATEALMTDGMSLDDAEQEVLRIVLTCRITDQIPKVKKPQ